MNRDFDQRLAAHIETLEQRPDFKTDAALRSIVEMLRRVKSQHDLVRMQAQISHLALDSVLSHETIEIILQFLVPYKK